MSKKELKKVKVKGKLLICPICESDEFWQRKTLMNTPGATFLGFDWANAEATNCICGDCGYIMWFWNDNH